MDTKESIPSSEHVSQDLHAGGQHEKPQPHIHGIVDAAHLYRGEPLFSVVTVTKLIEIVEDSEGRVLARLLLPRPTNDPNDPLVRPRPFTFPLPLD